MQRCHLLRGICRWWRRTRTMWIYRGNALTMTEDHLSYSTSSRSVMSLELPAVAPCGWLVAQWRPVSCQCVLENCCKETHTCSVSPPKTVSVLDHPRSFKNLYLLNYPSVCILFTFGVRIFSTQTTSVSPGTGGQEGINARIYTHRDTQTNKTNSRHKNADSLTIVLRFCYVYSKCD